MHTIVDQVGDDWENEGNPANDQAIVDHGEWDVMPTSGRIRYSECVFHCDECVDCQTESRRNIYNFINILNIQFYLSWKMNTMT